MCFRRPYIIPIFTGILSIASIALVFCLSADEDLIHSILPALGDLLPIEKAGHVYRHLATPSYVFQWFLFTLALLVSVIVYIRYRQFKYVCDNPDLQDFALANKTSKATLWVGLALAVALMILPYCIYYFPTQYMGVVVWLLILAYEILDVFLSILVYEELEIKGKIRIIIFFKIIIVIVSIAMLFVSKIFWEIAIRKFAPERLGSNYTAWQPGDWGYEAHLISAICEWVFAVATLAYFCILLAADFYFVHFTKPEMDIKCGQCQ